MVLFTVQLNLDTVSAATTSQTKIISSEFNQNPSIINIKTSTILQNSSTSSTHKSVATSSSNVKISLSQIDAAAKTVKTQIIINHKLPPYVTISNRQVTMPQFLQLLTTGLLKINSGLKTAVTLRTVSSPNPAVETVKSGTISSKEYLKIAKSVKSFIDVNHRVPSYARSSKGRLLYSTLIYSYCKIFNFQTLQKRLPNAVSIKPWKSLIQGRPIYITSDGITNKEVDNARINSIVKGLMALGLYAVNWGLGPNTHVQILKDIKIPQNALIIDIYGGACAGTLNEMGLDWYMGLKGTKKIFSIFWPPAKVITGLDFLQRAHDDDFTPIMGEPGGFPNFKDLDNDGKFDPPQDLNNDGKYEIRGEDGLANPDKYLLAHGYSYFYSGNINAIVAAIAKKAFT